MITDADLAAYRFLGLLARTDDYPPKDGLYQDYTYFSRTTLDKARGFWKRAVRLIRDGRGPDNVILYIHWPFCPSQCRYCFCSMTVPRSRAQMALYAESLKRELDAFKDVFAGVELASVYIGGGTPTFIPEEVLDGLFAHIHRTYEVREGAEVYVEASPATLSEGVLAVLARHGVNRITLGVQSRDPEVLRGVNRKGQTPGAVEAAWRLMAGTPGLIRDVDLMLGIERQDRLSFVRDLVWAIRRRADVIHINSFDARRQTAFIRSGSRLPDAYWPEIEKSIRVAERLLEEAGYRISHYDLESQVTDPAEKILSDDPFELSSMLAVGKHGKAHAFGAAWYQHPCVTSKGWGSVRVPDFFWLPGGLEEEVRAYVIRSLCLHEKVSLKALRKFYHTGLEGAPGVLKPLEELEACGKVSLGRDFVTLTALDPADRLVWLKHLYPPGLVEAMLRSHAREYKAFLRRHAEDRDSVLGELALKAEARSYHRVYYRRDHALS
jgi:coproporphyrinogen III oxidase-like Fe-S oxidoreductase